MSHKVWREAQETKLGCPVLVPGYLYSFGPMFSASAMYMSKLLPMESVPMSKLTTAHY